MKVKNIIYILTLALAPGILLAQIRLEGGAQVICQGSPQLVCNGIGWENEGNFYADLSIVKFSGGAAQPTYIEGPFFNTFNDLWVAKSSGQLVLQSDVEVEGAVVLTGGDLDLKGRVLELTPGSGAIINEAEAHRILGPLGGYITTSGILGMPTNANLGNMGMEISSTAFLSFTVIRRGHNIFPLPTGPSIERWYEAQPLTNTALDATLRLHYFDGELNGLSENNLSVWRSDDDGASWVELPPSAHNMVDNWIEVAHENSLAMYSIGEKTISVLPIQQVQANNSTLNKAMEIYPNPVKEKANFRIYAAEEKTTSLEWYNMNGALIHQTSIDLFKGENHISQMVGHLPAGMYLIKCDGLALPAIRMIKE